MSTMANSNSEVAKDWMVQLDKAKNFRNDYIDLVVKFCEVMHKASPDEAIGMAEAGLAELHKTMVFRINENTTVGAREAFFDHEAEKLETLAHSTKPSSSTPPFVYKICSPSGDWLEGESAKSQLQAWSDYGCMESSACSNASAICSLDDVAKVVQDKVFVLLGITSEMGPTKTLLQIPGAHVIGIARKGQRLTDLVTWFQTEGAPNTTLQVPKEGADMLLQGPSIARWIVENVPPSKDIILCQLAYMDAEAHVRISVAMDLICQYVCEKLPGRNVALSYLTSPATVHAIPQDAAKDAERRLGSRPTWHSLTSAVTLGAWLQETHVWSNGGLLNGLSHMQGPNYALAKTLQQWRCMVDYWKHGRTVSAPHAPPTRTQSMVRYSTIAAALEGMQMFEPLLSFSVDSSSSLTTAIMLHHVTSTSSLAVSAVGKLQLEHPMHILWDGSVHGGSWRCPYLTDSTGTLSFLMGKTMLSAPYVPEKSMAS